MLEIHSDGECMFAGLVNHLAQLGLSSLLLQFLGKAHFSFF